MTEPSEEEEFDTRSWDLGYDDDIDVDMGLGAADQDSAVAEFLRDYPDGHRIEEIEDHGVLGIDAELGQEVSEPEPEVEPTPVARREELARLLRAEEFAERVRERGR
ncbi:MULTISPECIES: hypothetical protein [unclassified Nocardiopsis]|uniref:hypothetical protein n=1 Tax=unclassified Nocardiopsis TaxID=2649073 RepID=UPI001356C69E|nr:MULTISPECIES: hypothetical protein [unclassified Nocardiopsis]